MPPRGFATGRAFLAMICYPEPSKSDSSLGSSTRRSIDKAFRLTILDKSGTELSDVRSATRNETLAGSGRARARSGWSGV